MSSNYSDYTTWPWSEYTWLPSGDTWTDVEVGRCGLHGHEDYTNISCTPLLHDCIYATVILIFVRMSFHCCFALPLARYCNVYTPQLTEKHQSYFTLGCYEYLTNAISAKSKTAKFMDAGWRWAFYSCIWIYAYTYLTDSSGGQHPYVYDFIDLWLHFPAHSVTKHMRMHYVIEVGYYLSALLICFKNDRHRKDFAINVVHHIVTLLLLYMSWTINLVRVGTVILLLHDAADGFIEMGKMVRYATTTELYTNIIFAMFIAVWIVTRLIIFPQLILSGLVDAQLLIASTTFPFWPAFLIVLLCILQVLHIIWSILIARIVINTLKPGGTTQDVRSDTEDSDGDE